jgi:hypothetical protein
MVHLLSISRFVYNFKHLLICDCVMFFTVLDLVTACAAGFPVITKMYF